MNSEIDLKKVDQMRAQFQDNPELRLRMNAVTKTGIDGTASRYQGKISTLHTFSNVVKTGDITYQKASGRCWLFATMNTMRVEVMRRCNLKTFELSQAYMMFWDKLEKGNYFLENILETLDEPLNGRLVSWLLQAPYNDGGQWDMAVALVQKYGVVPKEQMPESFSSSNSARMNKFLTLKAREYAKTLRESHAAGKSIAELREMKERMVEEIYQMLCICLGTPPTQFDFEYRDEEENFHRDENLTPHQFYDKYVGRVLDDYVSLINAPTADKPYHRTFTVGYLGNVKGGRPIRYLNLPSEELKRAAVAQLVDNEPVWFGCDVGQMLDREGGIMAMDTFDFENLLNTKFPLTKENRLNYGESLMTHAMVFMGVNLVDGKPNRWRVENSWGDKNGKDGWYVMSDEWFDQYNYQVVVNKKYLTEAERQELELEPIVLQPWDPMGSLA